jgi:hypothetical protein
VQRLGGDRSASWEVNEGGAGPAAPLVDSPNHHDRRLLAPEHESRRKMVHAWREGVGVDARSMNDWRLYPVA